MADILESRLQRRYTALQGFILHRTHPHLLTRFPHYAISTNGDVRSDFQLLTRLHARPEWIEEYNQLKDSLALIYGIHAEDLRPHPSTTLPPPPPIQPWGRLKDTSAQPFSQLIHEAHRCREDMQTSVLANDTIPAILNMRATVLLNTSFQPAPQSRQIMALSALAMRLWQDFHASTSSVHDGMREVLDTLLVMIRDDVQRHVRAFVRSGMSEKGLRENERQIVGFGESVRAWERGVGRKEIAGAGVLGKVRARCEWILEAEGLGLAEWVGLKAMGVGGCEIWGREYGEWIGVVVRDDNSAGGEGVGEEIQISGVERRNDGFWFGGAW